MRLEIFSTLANAWKKLAGSKHGVAHVQSPGEYKAIAASSNASVGALGANGTIGDFLKSITIVPATLSPGNVVVRDGSAANITVFAGGANSVSNLLPHTSEVQMTSANGGWAISTGANVSVVASGKFTS